MLRRSHSQTRTELLTMMPHERASSGIFMIPVRAGSAGISAWAIFVSACLFPAASQAQGWPVFRQGNWLFERSISAVGGASGAKGAMPNAVWVRVEPRVTRCVDPTESMKATFRPTTVGNCRSAQAVKRGKSYFFAQRCDYLGPVKTVIAVESDSSYTEVNEQITGPSRKRDTVVARRIGDCALSENSASPSQPVPARPPRDLSWYLGDQFMQDVADAAEQVAEID